jgi:DNA polymerase
MNFLTLDFETFYSQEYSLSKLTTEQYVRDPRFEVIGVALKQGNAAPEWYAGPDVAPALRAVDWSNTAVIAHHAQFDGFILNHHFGIKPAFWMDTLSMARALVGADVGGSLDRLSTHFGLGVKGKEVLDAKGKHLGDFSPSELAKYGVYCCNDAELTNALFKRLLKAEGLPARYPQSELSLVDMTVRMFTEPTLELDAEKLHNIYVGALRAKEEFMAQAGLNQESLRSASKFAQVLRDFGIEPPMKPSPSNPEKQIPALSKTDAAMLALLDHENERVRWAAEARLGTQSSLLETRAARFMDIAARGNLPVYLKYYGAHSGRWAGGDKVNIQNLNRGSELRKSIVAPPGHVLVVADSAQIEARTLAWLAGQTDLVEAFANGRDVYKEMASAVYGCPVEEVNKTQRFVGKVLVLGCGYGVGFAKLGDILRLGAMGPKVPITDDEARRLVGMYRQKNDKIVELWRVAGTIIQWLLNGSGDFMWGPMRVFGDHLVLPNGLALHYPSIRASQDGFVYEGRNTSVKLYGGKLVENVTQALARILVSDQMIAINKRYRVATMTHDEVVAIVPENEAEEALGFMIEVMRQAPEWASGLPLNAEGGYAKEYSK